jgi:hypothetical protein
VNSNEKSIPNHLELLATWRSRAKPETVRWFTDRGFSATQLEAGLLLGAPKTLVESMFSVNLRDAELPLQLPIPIQQEQAIASLAVLKPRQYFQ